MQSVFEAYPHFWAIMKNRYQQEEGARVDDDPIEIVFKHMLPFLERLIKNDKRSLILLFQFLETLKSHTKTLGNLYSVALNASKDENSLICSQQLGFDDAFFNKVAQSKLLDDSTKCLFYEINKKIVLYALRLQRDMSDVAQGYIFSAMISQLTQEGKSLCPQKIARYLKESRELHDKIEELVLKTGKEISFWVGTASLGPLELLQILKKSHAAIQAHFEGPACVPEIVLTGLFDIELGLANLFKSGMNLKFSQLNNLLSSARKDYGQLLTGTDEERSKMFAKMQMISEQIHLMAEFIESYDQALPKLKQLKKAIFLGEQEPVAAEPCRDSKKKKPKQSRTPTPPLSHSPLTDSPASAASPEPLPDSPPIIEAAVQADTIESEPDLPTIQEFEHMADSLIQRSQALQSCLNEPPVDSESGRVSLRNIRARELCNELKTEGWIHIRTHGSHLIYNHPIAPSVGNIVVPLHKNRPLSPGVVKENRDKMAAAKKQQK